MLHKIENYEINPSGFVRNIKTGNILKNSKDVRGYAVVHLSLSSGKKKGLNEQRLVAKSYLSNPENKPEVAHINGDKMDASIFNIRWATASENDNDKDIHGTRKLPPPYGNRKVSLKDARKIRALKADGAHIRELCCLYKISRSAIYGIIRGDSYKEEKE